MNRLKLKTIFYFIIVLFNNSSFSQSDIDKILKGGEIDGK